MKKFFVTGIGTDVGKTIVSSIIVKALNADYWKPVQTGSNENTDRQTVQDLVNRQNSIFYPERYLLKEPASPHYAAELEGVKISVADFDLPETNNTLIIEGAGGLLVPLNDQELMADLIIHLEAPVILVSRNYLGSINHTLLTIEYLRYRNISIAGIVFNGEPNASTETAILNFGNIPVIGRVLNEPNVDASIIERYAKQFQPALVQLINRNEFI